MTPIVEAALAALKNKIMTMIQRLIVTESEPYEAGEYPDAQVDALGKTSYVELLSPYGLAAKPPVGASGVKFNVQGESSNQVGIAYDPKTIPAHNSKEVVVGAFSATVPTYLKFTDQGTIEVWKGGTLVISDLITHVHTGVTTGAGLSGPPAP